MANDTCAISIERLTKVYGTKKKSFLALDAVDMTINKGEFVCIVGTSGCGKSTLLNIIGGFEPYTSGKILINGKNVNLPGADRGVVFQTYTLFPWLTVEKNIQYGVGLPRFLLSRF